MTRFFALVLLLLAHRAAASPRVVLVETRGSPALPNLVPQVEVHSNHVATVQIVVSRDADPMNYGATAWRMVSSGEATIVVWLAPIDRGFLVFAASGWPDRALVETVRVDAALGTAEIERTVALKIAGMLDTLLAPRVTVREILAVPDEAFIEPEWRIEVDAFVVRESHERRFDGRPSIAVSRAWLANGWILAPTLATHWQPSGPIEGSTGRASITELGASAGVEGGLARSRFEAFVRPRFTAAALVVRGVSQDERKGEVTIFAPYAGFEAGLRRAVSPTVSLGIVGGCDFALVHHHLTIDGESIVDLGQARVHVGVSLTLVL